MIDKKEIFRKIGGILSELNDQYKFLSDNPENLNDLELELFIANSHFLSDHIEILRKLNQSAPAPVKEAALEVAVPAKEQEKPIEPKSAEPLEQEVPASTHIFEFDMKPQHQESEQSDIDEEVQDESVSAPAAEMPEEVAPEQEEPEEVTKFYLEAEAEEDQPTDPEEIDDELEVDTAAEDKEPERILPIETPVSKPEPEIEKPVVHEVVIEEKTISLDIPVPAKAEPLPLTLNDRILAQQEAQKATVGSAFNNQPVTDLKSIISLNDKLLFVKDLFNGYSLAYSEAIELVNRYSNFEAAENFLKTNYAVKNNWASKQSTVDKLYEILNRRFAK